MTIHDECRNAKLKQEKVETCISCVFQAFINFHYIILAAKLHITSIVFVAQVHI